jgi:Tfp pilus assembly protein PilW
MTRPYANQRGFTVLESLVATGMLVAVLATMFAFYRYQMFSLVAQNSQLDTQQAGRAVLDLFTREVRQAGADPTATGAIAALTFGSPSKLQIQFDRNGNGTIDAGETVTYEYQCAEGLCTMSRTVSGGSTIAFATSAPTGSTDVFSYFDTTGTSIVPAGSGNVLTPAQLTSVRRVKIALTLQRKNPDPQSSLILASTYGANVDLRNRWMR